MMKLGPEQKKWVEALKSDKYNQTKGCLKNNEGYCCLGVYADLCGVSWHREPNDELYYFHNPDNDYRSSHIDDFLNSSMTKQLGLLDSEGSMAHGKSIETDDNVYYSLAELNDSGKFSFTDIAKLIEDNPEYFFEESK